MTIVRTAGMGAALCVLAASGGRLLTLTTVNGTVALRER